LFELSPTSFHELSILYDLIFISRFLTKQFKITTSQESIIQLELDDDEEENDTPHQRRRYSVSPMPQIRSSESQVNFGISHLINSTITHDS
jgi:hypothetical protein